MNHNSLHGLRCSECGKAGVGLPFNEKPKMVTYNYMAFTLGVLTAPVNGESFLHNNYIQISSPSIYDPSHLLACVPALGVDCLPLPHRASILNIEKKTDISGVIRTFLGEGSYARVVIDESLVPYRRAYGRDHRFHDNLVLGYCPDCDSFILAGYGVSGALPAMDEIPIFRVTPCPRDALSAALVSRPSGFDNVYLRDVIAGIRPSTVREEIDAGWIRQQLMSYIAGDHLADEYLQRGYNPVTVIPKSGSAQICYGSRSYSRLCQFVEQSWLDGQEIDMRPFRLLWEHKICLRERLGHVMTGDRRRQSLPALDKLVSMSNSIRLQAMDFYFTQYKQPVPFLRGFSRPGRRLKRLLSEVKQMGRFEQEILAGACLAIG